MEVNKIVKRRVFALFVVGLRVSSLGGPAAQPSGGLSSGIRDTVPTSMG